MGESGAIAMRDVGKDALYWYAKMEDRQMDLFAMLRRRLDWMDDLDPVGLDLFKSLSDDQRKKAKTFMVGLLRQEECTAYNTDQGGRLRGAVG